MVKDFILSMERADIVSDQKLKERESRNRKAQMEDDHYNTLSLSELAEDLRARCNLDHPANVEDLAETLLESSLILDRAYTRAMHDAGLGRERSLDLDGLKAAMHAQKLMRQTYDSLKKPIRSVQNDQKRQTD